MWLASASGGNQYQVTTDGTAEHPYRSPSQADDGTIAVGHGDEILRMKQNGTVLNRLDPPMLMNSVSHPMDGVPVDVAISPDGTKVAYSFYGYECARRSDGGHIRRWDRPDRAKWSRFAGHRPVNRLHPRPGRPTSPPSRR